MSPRIKFVDAPTTTAALRLDLSQSSSPNAYVLAQDFTIGHPSFSGTPGSIGVDYGYRSLNLVVSIVGTEGFALTTMQKIAGEVLRGPWNWLLFQFSPTSKPQWFKTFPGEPGDLSFENAGNGHWRVTVPLIAEGFSWGVAEQLGPYTIANDPAAGTNPTRVVLPDTIKGDAPAPCSVAVIPSVSWYDSTVLFASASFTSAAAPALHVWQTSSLVSPTAGADTTLSSADATFSGGTKTVVSFATQAGMVSRIKASATSTPEPGRYRVLVRAARSDTSSTFAAEMRLLYGSTELPGNGTIARLDRGASAASGYACLLDLGEFTFPLGGEGWSAAEAGSYPAPGFSLRAQRLSGTGSLWFDYIVLIPVSTDTTSNVRMMRTYFRDTDISNVRHGVWDADKQLYTSKNFGVAMAGLLPAQLSGAFPVIDPGRRNVFHLHHQVGSVTKDLTAANTDSITATADVIFFYSPRYLYLRGD